LTLRGESFVIFMNLAFDVPFCEIGIAAVWEGGTAAGWEGGTAAGPASLLFFILT
jgi:hypothetical protein